MLHSKMEETNVHLSEKKAKVKGKKHPNTVGKEKHIWKDEEEEILLDIFGNETIQHSLGKAKFPKEKTAVYKDVKAQLEGNSIVKLIFI